MRSGGYIAVGAYQGTDNQYRTTTGGFNDGETHHVVITSDGSSWKIYVDGVNQSLTSVAGTNSGDWFGDIANRDNINIGRLNRNGSAINYFEGTIDQVALYNYELLPSVIYEHYKAGSAT